MRRWLGVVALLVACKPTAAPAPASPEPVPATPAPDPEPPPTPTPEPTPEPEPAQAPDPEPQPDPLELSDQQLARARKIQSFVAKAAEEHGVDPNLLNGVIWSESKFNPKAHNRKSGARGLMQLMPKTGKAMAKRLERRFKPFDAEFSVQAGAKLLSILLEKFDGDEELALFGYARGGGRVRKYLREGGEIPEGVVKFIARVRRAQFTFDQLGFPND